MKKTAQYILALGVLFGMFGVGTLVNAATGLTIQPVKISQTLDPGESVKGSILLTNASENDVVVSMKIEDFIPTAGAEGVQFVGRTQGATTVRDWITLDGEAEFTFKKGESKQIPYTITAPAGAEPGGHFGVAFFKAVDVADAEQQLKVGTQVGVLVFITIPGNYLQKGTILDFTASRFVQKAPVNFGIKFENTGTVHFEPKGTIRIYNMFGGQAGAVPIEGQVVLPTGIKDLTISWNPEKFIFGKYKAVAEIVDGEGNILTSNTISFYALQLWYIGGFILGIIVLFLLLRFIRKKLRISVSLK